MARLLLRDLTPGTVYRVQFRSKSSDSVSEWSRMFTIQATSDTTPPDVPNWATSNAWVSSDDTFVATWEPLDFNLENNKDFSHYELRLTNGSSDRTFRTQNTSFTLTFEQNNFYWNSPQATLQAQVRSVDLVGNVSAYTTLKSATNPSPAAPASIAVTALYDSIKIDWDSVADSDLKSYRLFVSTTSASTGFSQIYEGSNNSYTHSTVAFLTNHWYRIYAVDKFGSLSTPTTSGSVKPKNTLSIDTTPPSAPTSVTVTSGSIDTLTQQQSINISWVASTSTDVDRYEIRYAKSNSGPWEYMNVSHDQTGARIDNLGPGWAYYVDIRAVDFSGNSSAWVNNSLNYPLNPTFDTTPPSKPAAPTVATNTQQLQVSINGNKASGGPIENDTNRYQVFASVVSGFTPGPSNMLGTVPWSPAMVQTFQIPASNSSGSTQNWYVVIKAVDFGGNVSVASDQVTASVGLIMTANIGDAQITTAKIQNLNADKIEAGSGIIKDLVIKSKLTLGDASTVGYIESYDYTTSSGTTGFQFSKNGLIIKTGAIESAALKIQDGANIMNPFYSDFEGNPNTYSFYQTGGTQTPSIVSGGAKFNTQHLRNQWTTAASNPVLYLASSISNFNVVLEANNIYITSAYFWNTGTVNTVVVLGISWVNSSGAVISSSESSPVTINAGTQVGSANRVNFSATAPAGTVVGRVFIKSTTLTASAGYNVDGIQVERKQSSLTTPSTWKPSASTTINGGSIRTGEIRSNTTLTINGVSLPQWGINVDGSAQFGNLFVRGNTIVGYNVSEDTGTETAAQAGSKIQSGNYVPGSQGWAIHSNGLAEFRNVVVGSLPGSSVAPGTLKADAIETGSILSADVRVTGALHAVGDMGEDIGLTGDGFLVLGPHQVSITSSSLTSQVATLTTSQNHGFAVGNKLVITDIGAPYDGTWTTKAGTAGNTIKYDITGASDIALSSGLSGLAKSKSTDPAITNLQPRMIEFPTDGANPNIISGELKADNLLVTKTATLMGPTTIFNTDMIVGSGISAPAAGPVISSDWHTTNLGTSSFSGNHVRGITIGHTGNFFVLQNDQGIASENIIVEEFSFSTGAKINSWALRAGSEMIVVGSDATTYRYYPRGLHYDPSRAKYFVGLHVLGDGQHQDVVTYNTSFVETASKRLFSMPPANTLWRGSTIGWDYVSNRIMHVISLETSSPSAQTTTVRYYPVDSGGVVGTMASSIDLQNVTYGAASINLRYVSRVQSSDWIGGTDRIVLKLKMNLLSGVPWPDPRDNMERWTTFNTSTGAAVSAEQWISPYSVDAALFNTTNGCFYSLSSYSETDNRVLRYERGDSWWNDVSGSGNIGKPRYVAYSFYDGNPTSTFTITNRARGSNIATITTSAAHGLSTGDDVGRWVEVTGVADNTFNGWAQIASIPTSTTFTYSNTGPDVSAGAATGSVYYKTHETGKSPVRSINHPKRARLRIEVGNIPKSVGESPDRARVYVGSTESNLTLRTTISHPDTAGIVDPMTPLNGITGMPAGTNGFTLVNNPSKITNGAGTMSIDGTGLMKSNNPVMSLYQPTAQTATNGIWIKLAMAIDSAGLLPPRGNIGAVNSSVEVKEAGYYHVSGQAIFASGSAGRRGINIGKFTTSTPSASSGNVAQQFIRADNATSGLVALTASGVVWAEPGDFFSVWAFEDGTASISVTGGYLRVTFIP